MRSDSERLGADAAPCTAAEKGDSVAGQCDGKGSGGGLWGRGTDDGRF